MTPEDQQSLAEMIVLTIKGSLGPILERLASLETQQKAIPTVVTSVGEVRDHVLALESKAPPQLPDVAGLTASAIAPLSDRMARFEMAIERATAIEKTHTDLRDRLMAIELKAPPVSPDIVGLVALALTPFAERIASTEAKLAALPNTDKTVTELRDRIVVIETKATVQPSADPAIGELRDRLVAVETKAVQPIATTVLEAKSDHSSDIAAIRDRLLALETKGAQPSAAEISLSSLKDRLTAIESRLHDDATTKEIATLRERIAVLETRLPIPGPAGKDGKDGADGMGVKDFTVEHDGERTFTVKYLDGIRTKTAGQFIVPIDIYRGVYVEGKTYDCGDRVTWAGSDWRCNETTTSKPGDGSKAWTLAVKRGRDGKDGRDAVTVPVVSIGGVKP